MRLLAMLLEVAVERAHSVSKEDDLQMQQPQLAPRVQDIVRSVNFKLLNVTKRECKNYAEKKIV
jgi:hypothetical protein